jgi:hypothetical protein
VSFIAYFSSSHTSEIENKIVVHFTNNKPITVDFLIAADGIHSPIRTQISQRIGSEVISPIYWCVVVFMFKLFLNLSRSGYVYYRAVITVSQKQYDEFLARDYSSYECWGSGMRYKIEVCYFISKL